MTEPAITLRGVGKRYRQVEDAGTFLARIGSALTRRTPVRDLWALRDIDLDVARGETLGVIGRNGSGKTTMLRLLSGVSAPTTGRLRVEGSIAPLIGVGVGFNGELSGRENVFANGRILGMSKATLQRDFDSIVEFSELEEFIDTPVKYYSSGMFLRLAFAVAIHVEPEVLLVDEVLAVGDMAFQLKCFERMAELQSAGTTTVIVTHNLGMLAKMCDRAVLLSHGRKVFDGAVDDALARYQQVMRDEDRARAADGGALVDVALFDSSGVAVEKVTAGERITARVRAAFAAEVVDPVLGFGITAGAFGIIGGGYTLPGEYRGRHGPECPLEVTVTFDTAAFPRGPYRLACNVVDPDGEHILGTGPVIPFYVVSDSRSTGVVDVGWQVEWQSPGDAGRVDLRSAPTVANRGRGLGG